MPKLATLRKLPQWKFQNANPHAHRSNVVQSDVHINVLVWRFVLLAMEVLLYVLVGAERVRRIRLC